MLREKDVSKEVAPFYTIKDIQRIFHCGRDKAYEIVNMKGFPKMNIGRKILVHPDALKKWIKQNHNRKIFTLD